MKEVSECLRVLVNTMIDNSGLADAPVNILINEKLYDVKEFYFDENIMEYVMVLEKGFPYYAITIKQLEDDLTDCRAKKQIIHDKLSDYQKVVRKHGIHSFKQLDEELETYYSLRNTSKSYNTNEYLETNTEQKK